MPDGKINSPSNIYGHPTDRAPWNWCVYLYREGVPASMAEIAAIKTVIRQEADPEPEPPAEQT